MRKWPVAAGLAAALLLSLPWALGSRAEHAYRGALSSFKDQGFQIVESRYERGWRRSTASADFLSVPAAQGGSGFRLRVRSNIHHGPWWPSHLRLRPAAARILSRLELTVPGIAIPHLLVDTLIELDGSVHARLILPATQAPTAVPLGLENADGRGELHLAAGSGEGWFELPAATLAAQGGERVFVRGFRLEVAGTRVGEGLFDGTVGLMAEDVRVALPTGAFEAGNVSVSIENRPAMGLLNTRTGCRVERWELDGRAYGPSEAALSLERVPGAELVALRQSLREISAQPVTESMAGIAMGAVLAELLPRLLAADPGVALERLTLNTPDGPVEGRASLSVQGLTLAAMAQPGAWISHLEGQGELGVPKALLLQVFQGWRRQQALADLKKTKGHTAEPPAELEAETANAAREQLAGLVDDGWLNEREGRVYTSLKLGDALLTINGKTLPVSVPDRH